MAKRKKGPVESFVALRRWVIRSNAWRDLRPNARALYVQLADLYFGCNNGKIHMSIRRAATELHIGRHAVSRAFKELQDHGFIRLAQKGYFSIKVSSPASTWILTEHGHAADLATRNFMQWKSPNEVVNAGTKMGQTGPITGQTDPQEGQGDFETASSAPPRDELSKTLDEAGPTTEHL